MPKVALVAVATLLAAALAAGCTSGPPVRFYVVTPITGQEPVARAQGPGVVVAAVRLPQYLERPQLVTRSGDNRLQLEEYHQWGGNLTKDLTRVMSENLSLLLGSEVVVTAPHTLRVRPDFRLELEVLRFERASDARVHLTAKWWLHRGGDGSLLAGATTTLASEPLTDPASAELTVAAMSGVYGELSRAIAQTIARQEKTPR